MPADAPEKKRFGSRRLRLAGFVAAAVLVNVLIGATVLYRHLTHPQRIRQKVEEIVQSVFNAEIQIGDVQFARPGSLYLTDVAVAHIQDPSTSPSLTCRQLEIRLDPIRLLLGRARVRSIVAVAPVWTIVSDWDGPAAHPQAFSSVRSLLRSLNLPLVFARDRGPGSAQHSPPIVELREACLRIITREQDAQEPPDELVLTLRALADRSGPMAYDIVWHQADEPDVGGHARLDLESGRLHNVQGGSPWMSVESAVLLFSDSDTGLSTWARRLALGGRIRASDFDFTWGTAVATPAATLQWRDASLSVPVSPEEYDLGPDDRYLRFEHVEGEVQLSGSTVRGDLRGMLHGASCEASGVIHTGGSGRDSMVALESWESVRDIPPEVAVSATMSVRDLRVPRPDREAGPLAASYSASAAHPEGRFTSRWRWIVALYRDYDPKGIADIDVEIEKQPGTEPIRLRRAVVTAKGGEARCRFLPYPAHDVHGVVEVIDDEIFLRNLRARGGLRDEPPGSAGGGAITVNGHVAAPKKWSAKNITVAVADVPLDHVLWDALPPNFRAIRNMFRPEGTIDAEMTFTQAPGSPEKRHPLVHDVRVDLKDVSARYAHFPYLIEHVNGRLHLNKGEARLENVSGRSGEASVAIEGVARFDSGETTTLDMSVRAADVPIDEKLFDALPETARVELMKLRPSGRFDADASIKQNEKSDPQTWTSDVTLRDASIRHEQFPVTIDGLQGTLRVEPDRIMIKKVHGRHGATTISATGVIPGLYGPAPSRLEVNGKGEGLEPQLAELLPAPLGEALALWEIDGPFSFAATLTGFEAVAGNSDTGVAPIAAGGPDAPAGRRSSEGLHGSLSDTGNGHALSFAARVVLEGATLTHPSLPSPLRNVEGKIHVDRHGLRGENILARYGESTLRVAVDLARTDGMEHGTITLSAHGVRLDESLRHLLPEALASGWAALEPAGTINLYLDRLEFQRRAGEPYRRWSVNGYVEFQDAVFRGAPGVTRMSGTLVGSGALVDENGETSLSGQIDLRRILVQDHRIENLQSEWSLSLTPTGAGAFTMPAVRARIYEAPLSGEAGVTFDAARTAYRLVATVHGMQLRPFLRAAQVLAAEERPVEAHGQVDGYLHLSGFVGEPAARRGGGRFEIREGNIYRIPLVFAVLNILNLTIPLEDAIDGARVVFAIMGNYVHLSDVHLRGSALHLMGSGAMTWPERSVDIALINVNPNPWARIPGLTAIADAATREIVELHITGSITRPTVRARPFRGVTDEFRSLFQRRKPRPRSSTAE